MYPKGLLFINGVYVAFGNYRINATGLYCPPERNLTVKRFMPLSLLFEPDQDKFPLIGFNQLNFNSFVESQREIDVLNVFTEDEGRVLHYTFQCNGLQEYKTDSRKYEFQIPSDFSSYKKKPTLKTVVTYPSFVCRMELTVTPDFLISDTSDMPEVTTLYEHISDRGLGWEDLV
jgi:hypothetical protein